MCHSLPVYFFVMQIVLSVVELYRGVVAASARCFTIIHTLFFCLYLKHTCSSVTDGHNTDSEALVISPAGAPWVRNLKNGRI